MDPLEKNRFWPVDNNLLAVPPIKACLALMAAGLFLTSAAPAPGQQDEPALHRDALTDAAPGQQDELDFYRDMSLGLAECLDIAAENNAQVIQSGFSLEVAEVQVENARNVFLPSISANYGQSRRINGPREGSFIDQSTGLLVTSLGESTTSGSQSTGASMSMSVYDPANWTNLAASKKGHKAAAMNLENTRQQILFTVKQNYFNLLAAIKLYGVQQEQVRVSQEDLRRAETLFEIRSVPLSDVLSTRANLESARATLIERENSVETARFNLGFTLGLDSDVRVIPRNEEFELKELDISYKDALALAMRRHPNLQAQKYSMLQARDQLKSTEYGVRHPTVSMSSGYNWSLSSDEEFKGAEDLFLKNYGYSFSLSVSMPIFNRLSTENSVKTQKLNYLQSLEGLDQAKRQAALDIRQAFLSIRQFHRSIAANKAALVASEESFKIVQERYELGAGTVLERLQAQSSLFQARNNLVQAVYNYHIQSAQLELAMGGPADEQQKE
jgi:outer membrane protein